MRDIIDTLNEKECPFCAEIIKAKAKKCKHCGEFMLGYNRKTISGDDIGIGNVNDAHGVAVGRQSQAGIVSEGSTLLQSQGDIILGKTARDEQYAIVLNWDGKTKMREFNLSERDLTYIELRDADLKGADLRKANLRGAKLYGVNLSGANLSGANLSFAEFRGTDLSGANLSGANLYKADMLRSNLSGANLSEANLKGVYLDSFTSNDLTIWPSWTSVDSPSARAFLKNLG